MNTVKIRTELCMSKRPVVTMVTTRGPHLSHRVFTSPPGIAAATMFMPETEAETELSNTQLRVAFDGDAVLFSDESEIIVKQHGLDTFFEHEKEFENKPLAQVT